MGTLEPIDKYIERKIKMLRKEFRIRLSEEDIDHFYSLNTYAEVDNFAHKILSQKL